MKKLVIVTCGVLCGLVSVLAGDAGANVKVFPEKDFWILTLSDKQLAEVECLRRVTLTKDQLKSVRELAPSFPKRVGVASPFVDQIPDTRFSLWPDQINGIWFCSNKVAIARKSLNGAEGYREFSKTLHVNDAVLVDTKGKYSIGPRAVDSERLTEILDVLAIKEPEGAVFSIFILRPPVLTDSQQEKVIQHAVDDLAGLCEERGLRYQIGG